MNETKEANETDAAHEVLPLCRLNAAREGSLLGATSVTTERRPS